MCVVLFERAYSLVELNLTIEKTIEEGAVGALTGRARSNQNLVVPGTWTGGRCANDYWHLREDGTFESSFPLDGEPYSWKGDFSFQGSTYIELGEHSDGSPAHNEANLYYVPALDVILFKGTRSLTGFDLNGEKEFVVYEQSEFPFFRRCTG